MGPTWGPSGADRTQVGPMVAPWTLLSRSFMAILISYKAAPISYLLLYWSSNKYTCAWYWYSTNIAFRKVKMCVCSMWSSMLMPTNIPMACMISDKGVISLIAYSQVALSASYHVFPGTCKMCLDDCIITCAITLFSNTHNIHIFDK